MTISESGKECPWSRDAKRHVREQLSLESLFLAKAKEIMKIDETDTEKTLRT